jgi:cytochrome d ubiquinol oxidase subunit II
VFWELFNPFTILAGFVSLAMLIAHGAAYLRLKIDHQIAEKAHGVQKFASFLALVCFIAAGVILNKAFLGFTLESAPLSQNIFTKVVGMQFIEESHELGQRFFTSSAMITSLVAFFGFLISMVSGKRKAIVGFLGTSFSIIGVISTAGFATFPFILPSTVVPNQSLTVWDASSSRLTLFIMLIAVLIFLPIVLTYVAWTYKVFSKKLILKDLADPQMY